MIVDDDHRRVRRVRATLVTVVTYQHTALRVHPPRATTLLVHTCPARAVRQRDRNPGYRYFGPLTPATGFVILGSNRKEFSRVIMEDYPDPAFARQLEEQFKRHGPRSVWRAIRSFRRLLAKHHEKLAGAKYPEGILREMRNFQRQLETAERFAGRYCPMPEEEQEAEEYT